MDRHLRHDRRQQTLRMAIDIGLPVTLVLTLSVVYVIDRTTGGAASSRVAFDEQAAEQSALSAQDATAQDPAAAPALRAVDKQRLLADRDELVYQPEALWGEGTTASGAKETRLRNTVAQQKRIDERDQLWKRAKRFRSEGQLAQAAAAGEAILSIEREVPGAEHEEVVVCRQWLAEVYEEAEKYDLAETHRREVLRLQQQTFGNDHWRATDARLALEYLRRLSTLLQTEREDLARASRLSKTSVDLYSSGQYQQALPQALEAARIRQKLLGDEHPDFATSLNNLGAVYKSIREFAEAEPLLKQALEIRKRALGDEHPDSATSLTNLASMYWSMGDYGQAEPLYKQALEIRKKVLGDEHLDTAASMNNLASVYHSTGDYAQAEPLLKQALAIDEKVLGEEHPDTGTLLNNVAYVYKSMGEYWRAEPLYKRALQIKKVVLGDEHPHVAASLNNLAALYASMGDYAQAEPLYKKASSINKKVLGVEHPDTATCLNNLAALYYSMSDCAKAEPLAREALEIRTKVLGEEHSDTAISLNDLGQLYWKMGEYAQAEPLHKQALKTRRKALGEEHPDTNQSLNNLALLYKSMGDYAQAEPLYKQSLEITTKVLGKEHPRTATSLANLGSMYYSMGDCGKAEPLEKEALEIRTKVLGEEHPFTAQSLNNLALLYDQMDDNEQAERRFRQALSITLEHLELTAVTQSQRQQLALTKDLRSFLDNYLFFCVTSGRYHESAYRQLLAWKGIVLLRQRAVHALMDEPALQPLFAELIDVTRRLARQAFAIPDPKQKEVWQKAVARLSAEREHLEGELTKQSTAYRKATRPVSLEELRQNLPEQCVLVDFIEAWTDAGNQLLAFVVRQHGPVKLLDLGAARPLAEAVDEWRSTHGRSEKALAAGRMLRERIWAPIEDYLWPDGRSGQRELTLVLVSPDGPLSRFPFGALPGKDPHTYLLEEVAIAVVPAPQMLPFMLDDQAPRKEVRGNMLLVGGVNYDTRLNLDAQTARADTFGRPRRAIRDDEDKPFAYLRGTLSEVESIETTSRDRWGGQGVTSLTAARATEEAVRREAPRHSHLHLATHGFFAAERFRSALGRSAAERWSDGDFLSRQSLSGYHPDLLSGIVLAGANDLSEDQDDGILTAAEVGALDLRGVEVAVLSACQTGLGQRAGGEGLLGLQRAFQAAGAQTLITSLWNVDDAATQAVMTEFYRNLWERKLTKLEALRQAQLTMLRNYNPAKRRIVRGANHLGSPDGNSPFYWAAFVLSGDLH